MLEIKGNLCKSTAKHQNFRLRRAISTEITTKYIVLSHLNLFRPKVGKNFGGVFLKKSKPEKTLSRAVHKPRYQELYLAPKTHKVTEI